MNDDDTWMYSYFLEAPSEEEDPDYYVILDEIVVWSDIMNRLDEYSSVRAFLADFCTMCTNCQKLHRPGTMQHNLANQLRDRVLTLTLGKNRN